MILYIHIYNQIQKRAELALSASNNKKIKIKKRNNDKKLRVIFLYYPIIGRNTLFPKNSDNNTFSKKSGKDSIETRKNHRSAFKSRRSQIPNFLSISGAL